MKLNDLLLELDVNSSWLVSIDYDEGHANVLMKTKSDLSYVIQNVPVDIFNTWAKSTSKGIFFHKRIKNKYDIARAHEGFTMDTTEDIVIKTKDGLSYIIHDLPKQLLNAWNSALSKRDFFFQKIKNKFRINKVDGE